MAENSTLTRPFAGCLDVLRWSLAVLLLLLLYEQDTIGRTDSAEWMTAKKLAQQIQTKTPKLSEKERERYLDTFAQFQTQHERLKVEEEDLVSRLTKHQDDLRRHTDNAAIYQRDREVWQANLTDHNAQCDRTFTDQGDVERCNQSGSELAKRKKALDERQAELTTHRIELDARQAKNTVLVSMHEDSYGGWVKSLERDFSVSLQKALERKIETVTLRLTVKSFIRTVDLSSMSAESRPRAEKAFAWFTNRNFSENPNTPASDSKDYRLWSQAIVVASCLGDTITSWKTSHLAHRGGKELRMLDSETSIMEALGVTPPSQGTDEHETLELSYGIKGKPNDAALPSFRAVRQRTCTSIWHRVRATVTCRDGKAQMGLVFTGSRFPSHRVWINNIIEANLDQESFSSLWDCDPTAPDLVR